jgi:hypothetical protein
MTSRLSLRWVLSISVLAISLLMVSLIQSARAQEADQVTLSLSPQIINVSANPGEPPIENVVRLTNGGDLPLEIDTIPKNILPTGEEGAVDLTEDQTSYSLAEWITVEPERISIAPSQTVDFTVSIAVPENGEPGGHFGTVVFKTIPPDSDSGAAAALVSQEIAPVILVSVAGDISEELEIESFGSTKSFWSNEKPITFETRTENLGSIHLKPIGTITIKNMFGGEVTTIPIEEKNVLPESIRRVETEWSDPGFAVGRYTADLSLVYGEDDNILTATTTFTVFPWQTLIPVGLIAIAVFYILIKFRSRIGNAIRVLAGKN